MIQAALFLLCTPVAVDGDTLRDCRGVYHRLARIQAPDFPRSRPCRQRRPGYDCHAGRARASTANLAALIDDRAVRCRLVDADPRTPRFEARDPFGRPVVRCRAGGRDLSEAQIAGSFAVPWPSPRRGGTGR